MGKIAVIKKDISPILRKGDTMTLRGDYYVKTGDRTRRQVPTKAISQTTGQVVTQRPYNFYHKEMVESKGMSEWFEVRKT